MNARPLPARPPSCPMRALSPDVRCSQAGVHAFNTQLARSDFGGPARDRERAWRERAIRPRDGLCLRGGERQRSELQRRDCPHPSRAYERARVCAQLDVALGLNGKKFLDNEIKVQFARFGRATVSLCLET